MSFSFDDFPKSSLVCAGVLLRQRGAFGTYYASLGLMGKTTPTGQMFDRTDIEALLNEGHELGCHTFDHTPAWSTPSRVFEDSVLKNQSALEAICPRTHLRTLSFPIEEPHPSTKKLMSHHFDCCRAGGQTFNLRTVDGNAVKAVFLDKRNRGDLARIERLVMANRDARGWLIFATHDVGDNPTDYGCTENYFTRVLDFCKVMNCRIVTVSEGWRILQEGQIDANQPIARDQS